MITPATGGAPTSPAATRSRLSQSRRRATSVDTVMRWVLVGAASTSVLIVLLVIGFLGAKAAPVVHTPGLGTFLGSAEWAPDGAGFGEDQHFGALMPIAGSFLAVGLALLIAVPLALAVALVVIETNPRLGASVVRPATELFLGIPSVVYGYLGFVALLPLLVRVAPPGKDGSGVLAAGVVLAVMVTPTIAALSADGLAAVPTALKEGSLALGATRWQTIRRVLLPAARASIVSGIVLGLARAMGEALAVSMVIGDVNHLPPFHDYGLRAFVFPSTTMTVTITDGVNQLALNPSGTAARYALALVLLLITFACIVAVRIVNRRTWQVAP